MNITPLTDLIVANLAQEIATNYYTAGNFAGISSASLSIQSTALATQLTPILTALSLSSSVDLLHLSFSANHTGMDALLDVLNVTMDPTTKVATIQNIINDSTLTENVAAGGSVVSNTLTSTGVAAGVSTFQDITTRMNALASLISTTAPSEAQLEALGLFNVSGFMQDAQNLSTWASNNLSSPLPGFQFAGMAVTSVPSSTSMWISFSPYFDGAIQGLPTSWFFNYDSTSGHYLAMGDQVPVTASLLVQEQYYPAQSSTSFSTGVLLTLNDPNNYLGATGTAVLSGPGISPTTYYKTTSLPRLTTNPPLDEPGIWMTDAEINQCPVNNLVYTITLYDSSSTLLDSFTTTLPMRPALSTELSASSFLTVTSTSPAPTGLLGWSGGTVSATWTVPATITPGSEYFWIELSGSSASDHVQVDNNASASGTSGSAVFPTSDFNGWTVQHGYWAVGGNDIYMRGFETTIENF